MKKDNYMSIAKVGKKGQIVIPKEIRDMFNIKTDDTVLLICNRKEGISLVKMDTMEEKIPSLECTKTETEE